METLNLISIQHELAMNIGLSLELRSMVREFMDVCLRRLDIRRVHLYLLPAISEGGTDPIPTEFVRISMSEGGNSPLICNQLENAARLFIRTDQSENVPEIIEQENLHFHLYSIKGMGMIVFERANNALPKDLVQALVPIMERLGSACKAALQHEQILQEVTRRKEAEKRIEHFAYHDDLTGLPNRRSLLMQLDNVIIQTKISGGQGILLHVDLDNFKDINESLGYLIGDSVIKEMAGRLRRPEYNHLVAARLGSDEFGILIHVHEKTEEAFKTYAVDLARSLQNIVGEPCVLDERTLILSASIGIIVFTGDSISADVLLGQSSRAMYQAKALGRHTVQFFDRSMTDNVEQKLTLDSEMRTALREDQFTLFLQPQVDEKGVCIGAEALIRWLHPEKGMVSPAAFIPMAEKSGFIVPMSDWVLKYACGYINQLETANLLPAVCSIAVNLSAKYFHQADFVKRVMQILEEMGTPPDRIELEITESSLIQNANETIDKINQLRKLGLRFSVDDFGTGYSSLTYLKQLPIDRIKIDRSFVRDVDTSPDDAAIVETILSIANHFKLNVIAEGVETAAEWNFLTNQGCREFQGFYFHRPLPFAAFIDTLAEKKV